MASFRCDIVTSALTAQSHESAGNQKVSSSLGPMLLLFGSHTQTASDHIASRCDLACSIKCCPS